jgi:hypothetical protein
MSDNNMYKFNDSFYLNLEKTDKYNIFGSYCLDNGDKFREIDLICFTDIQRMVLNLHYGKICVDIYFIVEKNTIKSTKTTQTQYWFNNFLEAQTFINKIVEFCYGQLLFCDVDLNLKSNTNKIPKINSNSENLDDLDSALLLNSFAVPYNDNACVCELFENNQIKYYYDLKIFPFANANVLMFYEVQEGYQTNCKIIFYDKLILLKSNYDEYNNSCYSINLFDVKQQEKVNICRLSKENYVILSEWISRKLNSSS